MTSFLHLLIVPLRLLPLLHTIETRIYLYSICIQYTYIYTPNYIEGHLTSQIQYMFLCAFFLFFFSFFCPFIVE